MAVILHYDEVEGEREYIVITDENTPEVRDENRKPGYQFDQAYELDGDGGRLPMYRRLVAE